MISEDQTDVTPWIKSIPPDWCVRRLDAVCDIVFSNVDKHTTEGEIPVKLCNYVDVYNNNRITAALDFMEASADEREIAKFQLRRNDVLATKDSEESDDIAIASLVAEELPGVLCGYHLAMIRPRSERITGQFLAWLYASKDFRAQFEAKAIGVTRFGLSQDAFKTAQIPLPPRPEQERISVYLESRCERIQSRSS